MKNSHISLLSHKRDREALEQRRLKAIEMYQKGVSQYRIAKELRVSFEAVSNWVEIYKKKGIKGLKTKGQPGPKPQLSAKDRERIKVAIIKGADAFGHQTSLWTLERIAELIRKMTKAKFQTTQTWRIVTSLGFSCQKPALRAKERDEKAIKQWRIHTFPSLKKMGTKT